MASRVRRIGRAAIYIGAAALVLNAARLALSSVGAQVPAGGGYTIVLIEQTTKKDGGASTLASLQTWARRSDGATALKLGAEGRGSRVIRLPSGIVIETQDVLRVKTTVQAEPVSHRYRDPGASCRAIDQSETFEGLEYLGRYRVAKITESLPDRRATHLLALDYDCTGVGASMVFDTGEKSELRLVALVPGPPSPALFDVPSDYKEGPPSTHFPANQYCGTDCQAARTRRDAEYFRHRVQ